MTCYGKLIFEVKNPFLGHFWPFLRVFGNFLEWICLDAAQNALEDSTDHYLQLFYWHQGPKTSSSSHFGLFWIILGGQKLGGHGFWPFSRVWMLKIAWNYIEKLGSNLYWNFRQVWGSLRAHRPSRGSQGTHQVPKFQKFQNWHAKSTFSDFLDIWHNVSSD